MPDPTPEHPPEPNETGRLTALKDKANALRAQGVSRLETERERRQSVRLAFDFYQRDRAFAGSLLAGGLAVKLFLWLLPFSLTAVVAIGSLATRLNRPPADIARETGLTTALASIVEDAVDASSRAGLYLGVLGVVLMIWAGIGVAKATRLVSRLAWQMPGLSHVNQLVASLAVLGFVLAMLLVNRAMGWMLGGPLPLDLIAIALTAALSATILVVLFRKLPHPEGVHWSAMVPGAILMAGGLLVTRLITVVYFADRLGSANDLYGALGLAGVFLAWLYIIARVLVGAIALNATLWQQRNPSDQVETGPPLTLA